MSDGSKRDSRTGRFAEAFPPAAFVEAVKTVGGLPTTRDIADEVGCSHRLAADRLGELEEAGKVRHETVATAYVWFLDE